MVSVKSSEGFAVFKHPSLPSDKECKTWYRIVGDLSSGRRPLVTLHGGPGGTHLYLTTPFESYAAKTGTPVVFYDQLGCGKSTHLREKRLDEEFWTIDLFVAELDNLVEHLGIRGDFDLFGHSWGAMLAPNYALSPLSKGSGLNKLVLGSGPASMKLWSEQCEIMIKEQPAAVQKVIRKYTEEKKWDAPEYKDAVMEIYKLHMCRLDPWPEILLETFKQLEEDDTTYLTMQGPDELTVIGSFRTFDMTESCKDITVPCLIINGEFDEASDLVEQPWFDGIPKVKWVVINEGSHMAHLERPEKYVEVVWNFLK